MRGFGLDLLLCLAVSFSPAAELTQLPSIGSPSRSGVASWYGRAHEGRKTASGVVFRRRELTAAHRTELFGTHYLVFYKDQVVEVLVNDRGPYVRKRGRYSRDLDLSEAAADHLGLIAVGVDKVSYKSIDYPPAKETSADQLLPLSPGRQASLE